jgi:tol-pal system protein YbgF
MLQSVQSLQKEVRELRGEIENQNHELEVLSKRQRDLYVDSDKRLRDLEVGSRGSEGQGAAPNKMSRSPADAPGNLSGAGVPAGDAAAAALGAVGSGRQAGGGSTSGDATDPEQEGARYAAAFDHLKSGRYRKAIADFRAFIKDYPESRYAANAQYWLGEANYVSSQFKTALGEFGQVVDRYPNSAKVADARLKIGYAHYEMENWEEARTTLGALAKEYPDSTVAKLAEQRLARMKQEGH